MLWDIFCRVIDNFGDIGVSWRLCAELARRGHTVRLWVDDASALDWMAPGASQGNWPGVSVRPWSAAQAPSTLQDLAPSDVWLEAFGCELPTEFMAAFAGPSGPSGLQRSAQHLQHRRPAWINLEYLSAEAYVERSHGLASPVLQGPARGWTKTFFYPGFSAKTGGLMRANQLQTAPPNDTSYSEPANAPLPAAALGTAAKQWLATRGIAWKHERLVSLFCYAPKPLASLLQSLAQGAVPTVLLVTAGRASAAVRALVGGALQTGNLRLHYLPYLQQADYDHLLALCDVNWVRGEDSLVQALWAGKPLVWHLYPQDDGAHGPKLEAFLNLLRAPASVDALHRAWNGANTPSAAPDQVLAAAWQDLPRWGAAVQALRAKLVQQDDLVTQLVRCADKNR